MMLDTHPHLWHTGFTMTNAHTIRRCSYRVATDPEGQFYRRPRPSWADRITFSWRRWTGKRVVVAL